MLESIAGKGEASVIAPPVPFQLIVLVPPAALASRIACRNDPAPLSLELVTSKIAADSCDESRPARMRLRIPRPNGRMGEASGERLERQGENALSLGLPPK